MRKVRAIEVLFLYAVCKLAHGQASTQPMVSSIQNAASYDAVVSPGCLIGIFGSNLAAAPLSANGGQSPATLGGVSVTVAGLPAPLLYVSPGQINLLIPFEVQIPTSTVAPVVVTSPGGKTSYNIRLTRNAPGIFTRNGSGTGPALVFDSNFQPVETVGSKDIVILYATGLGATSAETNSVVDEVEVYIGDRKAQVLFAGLAPGLSGIYQLNVMTPTPATDRIYLRSGQWQSNIANIGIKHGANTSNVKGTIDGLHPSSDPAFRIGTSSSVMLHAGTFTVGFDLASGAALFDVAAVGQAGSAIISVDPISSCTNDVGIVSTGQYIASISTLTPDAVRGDFSGSIVPLWDYLTCNTGSECLGFFLSTIPAPRLGSFWTTAAAMLPAANSITAAGPNAFSQSTGCLSDLQGAPGHFVIDAQNNHLFSTFGGVTEIPLGPFTTRVSTFTLYVDGASIASKDLNYVAPNR